MSSTIRMICLANSRKIGGRCVAGIDVNTGEWVRPVRDNGGALTLDDISYEDGTGRTELLHGGGFHVLVDQW